MLEQAKFQRAEGWERKQQQERNNRLQVRARIKQVVMPADIVTRTQTGAG